MIRLTHRLLPLVLTTALAAALSPQVWATETLKIANIVERSGASASSGTHFKYGIELAVKEINASGGILGRQIETSTADTQSNPGVAKGLVTKAIDDKVQLLQLLQDWLPDAADRRRLLWDTPRRPPGFDDHA